MLSLATLAALRSSAAIYKSNAARTIELANTIKIEDSAEQERMITEWRADAARFTQISEEIAAVVDKEARWRSYGTARWLTNIKWLTDTNMPEGVVRTIRNAIEANPAYRQQVLGGMQHDNEAVLYQIRLIGYYDPTTQTNRWAIDYTGPDGLTGVSDNERREDAEYRYNEIARGHAS